MKDNIKLVEEVYKDADMSVKTLEHLLECLQDKQNKITPLIEEIKNGYQTFKEITCEMLEECKLDKKETGSLGVMMANHSVTKEVKCDNSDRAISEMVIKGIDMSVDNMKKLLDKELKAEYKELGNKFLKFEEESIAKLKNY